MRLSGSPGSGLFRITHSPVRLLAEEEREAFIEGHRQIIAGQGGKITRTYETVLLRATLR